MTSRSRFRRILAASGSVALAGTLLAACNSGSPSPSASGSTTSSTAPAGSATKSGTPASTAAGSTTAGSATAGARKTGGKIVESEQSGATPNLIFPLAPATNQNGYNVNLTMLLWPALVSVGAHGKSVVNTKESLYSSMKYSNNDKTITIVLKDWKWSDGKPITSRDFIFAYNLLKYNAKAWANYSPGLFPTDVKSVSTPDAHTVVLNLDHSYNPQFYTDDVLSLVPLLPQHAWDKKSMGGPVGNYDTTAAGAKAVWKFLQAQGKDIHTFASNPLWQVVDGPWKLKSFATNGRYVDVPNKAYSGPDKASVSELVYTPFTSNSAELNVLRAGGTLDVGTLPLTDLSQKAALEAQGYKLATLYVWGVAFIMPNLDNPTVGPMLSQLYIRQALEDLIPRKQIVQKVYHGYASPGNGPVPAKPVNHFDSPLEKSGGPYPYDPAKAKALLTAHGWKVTPGGTDTCQRPGTAANQCGKGITAGEKLALQLSFSSGDSAVKTQQEVVKSSEAKGGISIQLKSEPFSTLVSQVLPCKPGHTSASTCKWQLVDFGYNPYPLYPSGNSFFNTGGAQNTGGYSNPKMDSLINQTQYGSSSKAFYAYENFAARQLPWLWVPDPAFIIVYKANLHGLAPIDPVLGPNNPQDWYYTSKKS